MQLPTLLFLAVVLHCTQRTGTFLHWYWNKCSDEMTDTEDMVDGKIHQWYTENNSRFPTNENIQKKLEKACGDLGNLAIESHDVNKDGLAYMMRIQKLITCIYENVEWSTKHIVDRNVEAATRYQRSVEKLRKLNETLHTIWNGIEFILTDVDQQLGWINDDVINRSEQLNRVYQTAQHIFYLLGTIVVAAFLHAPFITRASIILIVPLNLMAFLKHGNMEDCLGFGSTTTLIFFLTAVHYLMEEENGISHLRAYRQFKVEAFLIVIKSKMYESLTTTNVLIKKWLEVLHQSSNIKGSIIRNWQVAATWFRQHNLIYRAKTSNSGAKQQSISNSNLSLKQANVALSSVTKSIDNVTDKIEHLIPNTSASKPIRIESKEPSNVMPKKLTKSRLTDQDFCLKPPFGETLENLSADYPSAPEDKANDTNEIRTTQEKYSILTKMSGNPSSPEPTVRSHSPLDEARKDPITDYSNMKDDNTKHINNIETVHEKSDVMPKKSTESSSKDRVTCSNTLDKENSSAQEQKIPDRFVPVREAAKECSNPVPDDTKPSTEITEKPDPNATNSTECEIQPLRPVGRIEPNLIPSRRTVVQPNIAQPNENANASNTNLSPSRPQPATAPAYSQNRQESSQREDSPSSINPNARIQHRTEASNERTNYISYQSEFNDDQDIFDKFNTRIVEFSPISDLCGAMTQKGTPCRNKPSYGGPRCWRHCGGTISMASPARSSSSGYGSDCSYSKLCGAMTQKGTPCHNKPSYGGLRCWRH